MISEVPEATTAVRSVAMFRLLRPRRVSLTGSIQLLLLCSLLFLSFFPLLVLTSMSLRPTALIYVDFWGLPLPPTFENFGVALSDLVPAMLRTLVVAFDSIAGVLAFACPASYAFARMRFLGKGHLYYCFLAMMMIPGAVLLTPHFILAVQLHLRGTLFGLVAFYVAEGQAFATFLLTTYFRGQPEEVFESARVDGASDIVALWHIAIPLATPMLVTIAVMNFLGIYGDFIWPSLMLTKSQETLILILAQYNPTVSELIQARPNLGVEAAGYIVASVPQLLIFAFGMKFFIQGLTSGAIKA